MEDLIKHLDVINPIKAVLDDQSRPYPSVKNQVHTLSRMRRLSHRIIITEPQNVEEERSEISEFNEDRPIAERTRVKPIGPRKTREGATNDSL